MTVESTINRENYVALPGDDSFDFPFKYFKDTDIELYIEAVLQTSGYTVTPHVNGPEFGGTVTLSSPLAGGELVVIKRKLPNTQETDYVENDDFPSQVAEDDYDRAAMRDQDQQEILDRCLKTGPSSTITNTVIEDPDASSVGKALIIADGDESNTYKVVYSKENISDIVDAVEADANRAEAAANEAEADADRAENAANNITGQVYEGTLADGQTVITPTWSWRQGNLRVYLDGVLQQQSQYTENTTAGTVTLNSAVGSGVVFTLLSTDTDSHGAFLQQALNLSDVNDKEVARKTLGADSGENIIDNSSLEVNQNGVSGTVILTSDEYGHDRFKAGTSGCTYTFSKTNGLISINITSGSLLQVVSGDCLKSGQHTLSWGGTAQGRFGSDSYADSGITKTITGGSNVNVEWGIGTLYHPKLELGSVATEYKQPEVSDELIRCKRRLVDYTAHANFIYGYGICVAAGFFDIPISIPQNFDISSLPAITADDLSAFRIFGSSTTRTPTAVSAIGVANGIATLRFTTTGSASRENGALRANVNNARFLMDNNL